MNFDFTGERYVVTGASSGIGRQITLDLAAAGAKILAIARNKERLTEVSGHFPDRIITYSVDVCDVDKLEDSIKNFVETHGKLNGGVHAAGIAGLTTLKSFDRDLAYKIMQVNFWAGVDLLKLITKSKYGLNGTSTVMFSSIAAILNARGVFAYSASKSAVNSFVKTAAKEINMKKHRVNSILPGWVNTQMAINYEAWSDVESIEKNTLLGNGEPIDISGMVLFLLSDSARWITGNNIVVDGGYLA